MDAGFFASSLSCTLVAQALRDLLPDTEIIVYDRAGYGYSIRSHYAPWSFNEATLDLEQVLSTARGESLWLLGHSLGGLISARLAVAENVKKKLSGLVLIEPTHPQELLVNASQRVGARNIHSTMRLAPNSIKFGLGWLTDSGQNITAQVSPRLSGPLRTELQTHRIWSGAAREWNFVYPSLLDGTFTVPSPEIPTLLVVGDDAEANEPGQKTLYEDYLSAKGSKTVHIPGASHLGLMMGENSSAHTANAISQFILEIDPPQKDRY